MSAKGPDLKRYMEKKLLIRLVGKRKLTGYLRGYDQFMNLVVENCVEILSLTEKKEIGTVVIRGAAPASGFGGAGEAAPPRRASRWRATASHAHQNTGNSVENFELQEREAVIDRCTGNTIG